MKKTFLSVLLILSSLQPSYAFDIKEITPEKNNNLIALSANRENVELALSNFVKEISSTMENYLKEKLNRSKVGFSLTHKIKGDIVTFEVPEYINRDTVFDLKYNINTNSFSGKVLEESDLAVISSVIKKYFSQFNSNNELIMSNVQAFPYSDTDKKYYAVSTKSISDLYVKPTGVAGDNLATQTRMGTPFKILYLSSDKKFAKVLSEDDKYIAWIKRSDLIETNDQDKYGNWINSRNYILNTDLTSPYKIYSGTILKGEKNKNAVKITLPDNKSFIIDSSKVIKLEDLSKNKDKVIQNAKKRLDLGIKGNTNYLWGGSVTQSIDCSGFNQAIFRLEGIMLPRDADQQQSFTKPVAKTLKDIAQLKPGDLLFFSGNKSYATHTGIYIGNYKFIHSSPKGAYKGIKINTLKGGGSYDKTLQSIYFGGGRI